MKQFKLAECNTIKGDIKKYQFPLMLTDSNDRTIVYIGISNDKVTNAQRKFIIEKLKKSLDELILECKDLNL